jgi:hypothetical protein
VQEGKGIDMNHMYIHSINRRHTTHTKMQFSPNHADKWRLLSPISLRLSHTISFMPFIIRIMHLYNHVSFRTFPLFLSSSCSRPFHHSISFHIPSISSILQSPPFHYPIPFAPFLANVSIRLVGLCRHVGTLGLFVSLLPHSPFCIALLSTFALHSSLPLLFPSLTPTSIIPLPSHSSPPHHLPEHTGPGVARSHRRVARGRRSR